MLSRKGIAGVALLAAMACGCGGGDGGGAGDTGAADAAAAGAADAVAADSAQAAPALVDLEVTLDYAGALEHTLRVGAFRTNPPSGPPLALDTIRAPSWPQAARLRGLEAGRYFVIGQLDVPPSSPTLPGCEDGIGASAEILIEAGVAPAPVAVTIEDPDAGACEAGP